MRVSTLNIFNTFLKYDNKRQSEINRYTKEVSSGKRLLEPSVSPVDLAQSLRYKSLDKELDDFIKNANYVQNAQTIAEDALTHIIDSSMEVRGELVHILNTGVFDEEDAKVLKDYFEGMRNYFIDQANTKIGDHYLFSGVKSQTAPIDSTGKYQGGDTDVTVPIAKNVELPIKYTGYKEGGDNYLGVGSIDGQDKMIVVAVLDKVINALNNGDLTSLHNDNFIKIDGNDYDLLSAFDKGVNTISQHRSRIGSQEKALESIRVQHESFKVSYNKLVSDLEDADLPKSITNLEKSKLAYEATMASFNQNKDLSLLKYFS